jgi:hypothetical protein
MELRWNLLLLFLSNEPGPDVEIEIPISTSKSKLEIETSKFRGKYNLENRNIQNFVGIAAIP